MSIQQAHADPTLRSPPGARYAVIASRWNAAIVDALVEGARRAFAQRGVAEADVRVMRVPGAWELPMLADSLARGGQYAAIVALGCVVRGETRHFEQIADNCAQGLMRVMLDHRVPVANGVLAVEREADALARAGGAHGNKGEEAAQAAMEMVALIGEVSA